MSIQKNIGKNTIGDNNKMSVSLHEYNMSTHDLSTIVRNTQVVLIMDNMYLDFFFFFVPNRLLWTNWERFNGAQDDPADTIDYTLPTMPF